MEYGRRALDLNPSGADTLAIVAIHTCWTGDGTGLIHAQRAMALNPNPSRLVLQRPWELLSDR